MHRHMNRVQHAARLAMGAYDHEFRSRPRPSASPWRLIALTAATIVAAAIAVFVII